MNDHTTTETSTSRIFLVRHGESVKGTYEDPILEELYRGISDDAMQQARQVGGELAATLLHPNNILGIHSGRARSIQTLNALLEGMGQSDAQTNEDFRFGYCLDQRYVGEVKRLVKAGRYSSTIAAILNINPEQFFDREGIRDYTMTQTAVDMQIAMRDALRDACVRASMHGNDYDTVIVSHEPLMSLCGLHMTQPHDKDHTLSLDETLSVKVPKFEELGFCWFDVSGAAGKPSATLHLNHGVYNVSTKLDPHTWWVNEPRGFYSHDEYSEEIRRIEV